MAFTILALLLLLFWIYRIDMVDAFSPVVSVSSPGSKIFKYGVTIFFFLFIILMMLGFLPSISFPEFSDFSSNALLLASIVSVITMIIVTRISSHTSIIYTFLASLIGINYYITGDFDVARPVRMLTCWIVAPLISMIMGMGFYALYKEIIGKSNKNIFEKAQYLKYVVIFCTFFLVFSLSINYGSLFLVFNNTFSNGYGFVIMAAAAILLFAIMNRSMIRKIYRLSDLEFDISLPISISILLSSSIVMLIFMKVTPLSLPSLLFASMFGIGCLKNREVIDKNTLLRKLATIFVSPIIAIILSYLACSLINGESLTSSIVGKLPKEESNLNLLFFISVATIGLIFVVIMAFQRKAKSDAHNLSFSQQQVMYENQNELNSLEMKTIIAENQSLYSRLDAKRKELVDVALNISEQKEFIENLYDSINRISIMKDSPEKDKEIEKMKQYLFQRMSFSNEIDVFYAKAEMLHKDFSIKLREKFPNLTSQERKLATLLRLGFSTKEISTLMNISPKSGEISRYRLRKKLNLSREDNLIKFIKSL